MLELGWIRIGPSPDAVLLAGVSIRIFFGSDFLYFSETTLLLPSIFVAIFCRHRHRPAQFVLPVLLFYLCSISRSLGKCYLCSFSCSHSTPPPQRQRNKLKPSATAQHSPHRNGLFGNPTGSAGLSKSNPLTFFSIQRLQK